MPFCRYVSHQILAKSLLNRIKTLCHIYGPQIPDDNIWATDSEFESSQFECAHDADLNKIYNFRPNHPAPTFSNNFTDGNCIKNLFAFCEWRVFFLLLGKMRNVKISWFVAFGLSNVKCAGQWYG